MAKLLESIDATSILAALLTFVSGAGVWNYLTKKAELNADAQAKQIERLQREREQIRDDWKQITDRLTEDVETLRRYRQHDLEAMTRAQAECNLQVAALKEDIEYRDDRITKLEEALERQGIDTGPLPEL